MDSIRISEARHLNGHPELKRNESCSVVLDQAGIHIRAGLYRWVRPRAVVNIPWSEVETIDRDGQQMRLVTKQAGSRVTATRVAAFGVFALAARKQTPERTTALTFNTLTFRLLDGTEFAIRTQKKNRALTLHLEELVERYAA